MKLTIDDRVISATEGMTLLDAAEAKDIYIPHLCSHPQLSPYGGCRMCIVEVEGTGGFPTACTTLVQPDMKVRTGTAIIQEMRKEILQLILSEHPSGCLICQEAEECSQAMDTIRKVGVTTGCRWCPKDEDCELQRVVRYLEVDSIKFPVYYQDLEVERYDPFYDRDYNLCIYCARCVRICGEHRMSHVLGLHERGKDARVGPAFHLNHIQADCEFCGACVSVCPTGALSEKNRKWAGVPGEYKPSICPLCSLHCSIQFPVKNDRIMGVLPPGDPHQSGGELCVKGRFCLTEIINHPERLTEPLFRYPEGYGVVTWEEAVKKAVPPIDAALGKRSAIYLSPNLSLEEFAAAGRFASEVLHTSFITSSVLDEHMLRYFSLWEKSVPLEDVEEATAIVTFFFTANYEYAPLTLAMKRAVRNGATLCRVGWTGDTLSRFATLEIIPPRGKEKEFTRKLTRLMESGKGGNRELKEIIKIIAHGTRPLVVLGPQSARLTGGKEIMGHLEMFAALACAGIHAPLPFGNLSGLLSTVAVQPVNHVNRLLEEKKIDLLYMVGDSPFRKRPPVDFIIYQGAYPPPDQWQADLVLPAPTWGETQGTYASGSHRLLPFLAAFSPREDIPGMIDVLARIATAMGHKKKLFSPGQLAHLLPKNPNPKLPAISKHKRGRTILAPDTEFPFLLVQDEAPRGIHHETLNRVSPGLEDLRPLDTLLLHPQDAAKLNLDSGERASVASTTVQYDFSVKVRHYLTPGLVYLYSQNGNFPFQTNPCAVQIRRSHV